MDSFRGADQPGAIPPSASNALKLLETKFGKYSTNRRINHSAVLSEYYCGACLNLAHNRNDAFYLRCAVNRFYPEERASLLVGQQIQQPVWTLLDLADSLLELGQHCLPADRQSILRIEDDAL